MPELPEVETIKRQLESKIAGLTIRNVEIKKKRLFMGDPKEIMGAKARAIKRRAKMIIIDLDNNLHLLVHLKMTGQLIYADKNERFGGGHPIPPFAEKMPGKYTYIIFDFSDGSHLYYNDIRQFGWIKVIERGELREEIKKYGPEPLSKDFTWAKLRENLLKHKNLKIKPTLMDQSVVAGLGNIYAAEVCFQAGIRPDRKISTLIDQDFKNLYESIKNVLALAVKYQGTSADSYVTLEGKKGNYESKLWVYGRNGQPCPNKCGGVVQKMMLAGRGTYFCSACQH